MKCFTLDLNKSAFNNEYFRRYDNYEMVLQKDKHYCSLNVDPNGDLEIAYFTPKIRKNEINDFLYRTVSFYLYKTPNGAPCFLIRGALCADCFIDTNLFNDDRIHKIKDGQMVIMYLVDTHSDRIKGLRTIGLEDSVKDNVQEQLILSEKMGISSELIVYDYMCDILSKSPNDLLLDSTYIGKNTGSITPSSIVVFGE